RHENTKSTLASSCLRAFVVAFNNIKNFSAASAVSALNVICSGKRNDPCPEQASAGRHFDVVIALEVELAIGADQEYCQTGGHGLHVASLTHRERHLVGND